jgi:hypothetical protein
MNDRSNGNVILPNPVDDAIAIGEQLTNVLIIEFRDFAARKRESSSVRVRAKILLTTDLA